MPDTRTIEEVEQRLDQLCKEYLRGAHSQELHDEIIKLGKLLEELKKAEQKDWGAWAPPATEHRVAELRVPQQRTLSKIH
jgi:hypothetical protein